MKVNNYSVSDQRNFFNLSEHFLFPSPRDAVPPSAESRRMLIHFRHNYLPYFVAIAFYKRAGYIGIRDSGFHEDLQFTILLSEKANTPPLAFLSFLSRAKCKPCSLSLSLSLP